MNRLKHSWFLALQSKSKRLKSSLLIRLAWVLLTGIDKFSVSVLSGEGLACPARGYPGRGCPPRSFMAISVIGSLGRALARQCAPLLIMPIGCPGLPTVDCPYCRVLSCLSSPLRLSSCRWASLGWINTESSDGVTTSGRAHSDDDHAEVIVSPLRRTLSHRLCWWNNSIIFSGTTATVVHRMVASRRQSTQL